MLNGTEDQPYIGRFVWLRSPWVKWTAVALLVAWTFFALSAYYVAQKPFSPEQLAGLSRNTAVWLRFPFSGWALLRSLLDILAALWIVFAALGVGLWLLARLKIQTNDLALFLYGTGSGLGALGLLVFLLGLAGWLYAAALYGLLIALTLLTGLKTLRFLCRVRPSLPSPLILVGLSAFLFITLLQTLLPPLSWDALFYHLSGPKTWLALGQIGPGIDVPHYNFPALFEMLFLLAMGIRGDSAAKLLHFTFIFLLAGLVYLLGRDYLRLKNGWTAVLFLAAIPMIWGLGAQAYNDLALAFYQVAALTAVFQWQRARQERWLALAGALAGLAMGLKYTSFVTPLLLAGLVLWAQRRHWPAAARSVLLMALAAAVVAFPWYLKNFIFTGNPIYPFIFGGLFWDDYRSAAYANPGSGIGLSLVPLLRLPYDMILGLRDASADGPPGPLPLIFLPLVLFYGFSRWRAKGAGMAAFRGLLLFALAQYVFWVAGVIYSAGLWQSRLLLAAFVALAPALAWIWQDLARFDHPQFSLRRFLGLAVAITLVLNLLAQFLVWLPGAPWAYVLGSDSRSQTLERYLGDYYRAMTGINELTPPDAAVLFLYEPRNYYCERECRQDSILDRWGHMEYLYGNAADIAAAWRAAGVTHVLIFEAGLDFVVAEQIPWVAPQNMAVLDNLRARYLTPVPLQIDSYSLYQLEDGDQ